MRASFHTVASLGAQQSLTREGFLLCSGVPIARTGGMHYTPDELHGLIKPGRDGLVLIQRDEAEVFRDEFIASLNGKPVVDDHPGSDVTPDNWHMLSGGTMMNVRRGTGELNDCLVADLLITRGDMIQAVRTGKRQVSLGYIADYIEVGPGLGRQENMLGNHIALVDAGRCGVRCAIGDHQKEIVMQTNDHAAQPGIFKTLIARMRAGLNASDTAAVNAALTEAESAVAQTLDRAPGGDGVVINLTGHGDTLDAAVENRFKKIESTLDAVNKALTSLDAAFKAKPTGDEDKEDEKDEEKKKKKDAEDAAAEREAGTKDARSVTDSAPFADAWQATLAAAEILVPGIQLPTYDAKQPRKQTMDAMCKLRRDALDLANSTADGRALIEQVNGGALKLDGMSCDAARMLFNATSAAKRASNASALDSPGALIMGRTSAGMPVGGGRVTLADLNRINAQRYASTQ